MSLPHFQDPDRINPASPQDRLPTATYSAALDHLVIACVDVVLTHQTQVLLAKRNYPPRQSWWVLGGRMIAGESPPSAACRKIWEEGALQVHSDRFQFIGVYSTCFAQRQQPPQNHGSHSLNITYQIELSAVEKTQLKLSSTEYQAGEWMQLDVIHSLLSEQIAMDSALLQILKDLQKQSPFSEAP
jgi:ADP-ribose pyrophosphatase YjhB (NUDIX family)